MNSVVHDALDDAEHPFKKVTEFEQSDIEKRIILIDFVLLMTIMKVKQKKINELIYNKKISETWAQ